MITSFGKFRLLQRIGGGRLSQVFRIGRIWGQSAPPKVVLKRVAPELIGERSFVQLVAREAGLLARIDHANLCKCEEMGVIDGCAFVTIDQVDGCTLRALMRRLSRMDIRLPSSAVLALASQAAEVLDYLHRRCPTPLVHLDLSPQNVMISRGGQLKLIDFGIARFLDGHDPPPLDGRIAGTIGYMSPEQARGDRRIDARADQYALGILLWEALSGRRLFPGGSSHTWRRMREGATPALESVAPTVARDLTHTVDRLLSVDPADRYTDLGVVSDVLARLTSSPLSGQRPLAALTNRLMGEDDFDPFDVVRGKSTTEQAEQAEQAEQSQPEVAMPEVARAEAVPPPSIPTGEASLKDGEPASPAPPPTYEELSISVDHGDGTPSEQMRAIVPTPTRSNGQPPAGGAGNDSAPDSPFLEPSASFDADFAGAPSTRRDSGRD